MPSIFPYNIDSQKNVNANLSFNILGNSLTWISGLSLIFLSNSLAIHSTVIYFSIFYNNYAPGAKFAQQKCAHSTTDYRKSSNCILLDKLH